MKKAYLLLLAGMLSTAISGSKQTIRLDGADRQKTVSGITFDGDNVVLEYSIII